jgi:hypothetical protein
MKPTDKQIDILALLSVLAVLGITVVRVAGDIL